MEEDTNFLGRGIIESPPGNNPNSVRQHSALIPVIVGLLLVTICLFGAVLILSSKLHSLSKNVSPTNAPVQQTNPVVNVVATAMDTQLKKETNQPGGNIYTKSIDLANDTKRRADINTIATTLNVYMMEKGGLPNNFPDQPQCIGTDAACFDLYKLVVPTYLDAPLMDPITGSSANTGYRIGASHDKVTIAVVQATGSTGQLIEIKK